MTTIAELAVRARASDEVVSELEGQLAKAIRRVESSEHAVKVARDRQRHSIAYDDFEERYDELQQAEEARREAQADRDQAESLYLDYALGPAWRHTQLSKGREAAEFAARDYLRTLRPELMRRDLDFLARELAVSGWTPTTRRPTTARRLLIRRLALAAWLLIPLLASGFRVTTALLLFGSLPLVGYLTFKTVRKRGAL